MTKGKSVTFRTTYKGPTGISSMPGARGHVYAGRMHAGTVSAANKAAPPVSINLKDAARSGNLFDRSSGARYDHSRVVGVSPQYSVQSAARAGQLTGLMVGMLGAETIADAIWDHWADTLAATPQSEATFTRNADGTTTIQPAVELRTLIGAEPPFVTVGTGYNNPETVAPPPNPGDQNAYYYPPPVTPRGSFQIDYDFQFAVPYGAAQPTYEELLWKNPVPQVRPIPRALPAPSVYNQPDVFYPEPPAPPEVAMKWVKGRDGQTKYSGKGVAILSGVARAMGEGLEWIEVMAEAMGFTRNRKRYFDDLASADLFNPDVSDATAHQQMLEFLAKGYGDWNWDRFFDALSKKVAEDIIGRAVFNRAVRGARQLGISTNYAVTNLPSF